MADVSPRMYLVAQGTTRRGWSSQVHLATTDDHDLPTTRCGKLRGGVNRQGKQRWTEWSAEGSVVTCAPCRRAGGLPAEPEPGPHEHVFVPRWRCEHEPACNDYPCYVGRFIYTCRCGEYGHALPATGVGTAEDLRDAYGEGATTGPEAVPTSSERAS